MQSCLQTVTDPGTKNIWNWNKHTTLRTTLRARKKLLRDHYRAGVDQNTWNCQEHGTCKVVTKISGQTPLQLC